MPETRIVRPESTRLEISGGDWLLVKRRLNAGEQRRAYARVYRGNAVDGKLQVDTMQTGLSLILSYLLDWSLVDEEGHVIAIRDEDDAVKEAALDAIDYRSFVEIKEAIERHEAKNDAEAAAKKTMPAGESPSAATSPSPVAADGGSSGSRN